MTPNEQIKRFKKVSFVLAIVLFMGCFPNQAQSASSKQSAKDTNTAGQDMAWWREARFGLFIHWGPVSIKGTEIGWSRGREIPAEVYDSLYKEFNPTRFDAVEWVSIAKAAGAKYIVITSKHHDGFCIFDSKYTDYDITATPFKRDVIKELSQACQANAIKLCFYHSIIDWHHPDYLPRGAGDKRTVDDAVFDRYVTYMKNQLRELLTNYGPIGILWFDGEWDPTWTHEQGLSLYQYIKGLQPNIIINNRVDKGREGMDGTNKGAEYTGDYDTPEQKIGKFNTDRPWETCMTICQQWAWKPNDHLKSLKECIDTLVRVVGGDGNFLLNIGPMPDGQIEPRQVERLREIGDWLGRYGQSVYKTRGGPFKPGTWGASTHKNNTIYIHILNRTDDTITLPPIPKQIIGNSVLTGGFATVNQSEQGIEISLPQSDRQKLDTIITLQLDGPASEITPCDVSSNSLTAGKKAEASNVYKNMREFGPDKAVDDDSSTRWATDYGVKEGWLEVDLGKPTTFNSAKISEEYDRVQEFELQYKIGNQWWTFARGTKIGPDCSMQFDSVTARYIRLNILKATDGPTIWEFQLYVLKR